MYLQVWFELDHGLTCTHGFICGFQVFRPRMVNDMFMKNLGTFLNHVKSIDTGSMQIQGATGQWIIQYVTHMEITGCKYFWWLFSCGGWKMHVFYIKTCATWPNKTIHVWNYFTDWLQSRDIYIRNRCCIHIKNNHITVLNTINLHLIFCFFMVVGCCIQ